MTLSSPQRIYIYLCLQAVITSIQFKDSSKLVFIPAGPLYFWFTYTSDCQSLSAWAHLLAPLSRMAKSPSGKVSPNAELSSWASLSCRSYPGHSSLPCQFSSALKQILCSARQSIQIRLSTITS